MAITLESLYERRPRTDIVYDVLVAGGGPAAIGAALGASLNGARVLILEARSQFGGTGTAAILMNYNSLFKDNRETDRGGVCGILAGAFRAGTGQAFVPSLRKPYAPGVDGNRCIHPEYQKQIIFELFDRYKIDYSLYAPVCGVIKEGNIVTGVVVSAKQGELSYRAKVVIDATGDGDAAWYAGCKTEDEKSSGGKSAPVTVSLALGNVDTEKLRIWLTGAVLEIDRRQFKTFKEILAFAYEKGYLVPDWIEFDESTIPGTISLNNGTSRNLRIDGTKSFDLTIVERLGVEEALEFIRFCRDYKVPGLENPYVVRSGGYVSVRETRRFAGEYTFTDDDFTNGTNFLDGVAGIYGSGESMDGEYPEAAIKQGILYPYRALLPKTVDGLLMAGRSGASLLLGHYGGNNVGNMLGIGEAAGVAGAICARIGKQPRKLDYKLVQEALGRMGVSL